jgi:hypothetical protein
MKTDHLHDLWAGPDNTRLTSKQFSFRFPVHIAAKIAALAEMYPTKNRTQIVADLLTAALDDFEKHMPEAVGEAVDPKYKEEIANRVDKAGQKLFHLGGARGQFRAIANRHYRELEAELGNEHPAPLFEDIVGTLEDFGGK